MRILIVDDSEMMRDVVRQAIEDNVQGLTWTWSMHPTARRPSTQWRQGRSI